MVCVILIVCVTLMVSNIYFTTLGEKIKYFSKIFKSQYKIMDPQPTNPPECSLCSAANATNLKCEECLRKINSIPSGFPFRMTNKVSEYECPICLSLIRDATELTCSHLICRACLEFYENGEIQKNGKYVFNQINTFRDLTNII